MEDREGWETMSLDGQQVRIKTVVIQEKSQAFETLIIYVSTLQGKFELYLPQLLEPVSSLSGSISTKVYKKQRTKCTVH